MLRIAKISPDAILPTRAHQDDAGVDLYACESITIPAKQRALVDTGIATEIPVDCYGRVAPRSGLAVNYGIQVGAGVVDAVYRGTIRVLLFNHGDADFVVNTGDRIAQLIIERILTPTVVEVDYSELTTTSRGDGGFGSSGTN